MEQDTAAAPIENDVENSRFVLRLGQEEAELTYRLGPTRLILDHVGVPAAWRNRGHAARLTRYVLDWARKREFEVVPTCPYVIWYIQQHPEYQDLVR